MPPVLQSRSSDDTPQPRKTEGSSSTLCAWTRPLPTLAISAEVRTDKEGIKEERLGTISPLRKIQTELSET